MNGSVNGVVRAATISILCGGCLLYLRPARATAGAPPASQAPAPAITLNDEEHQKALDLLEASPVVEDLGDEKRAWEVLRQRLAAHPQWLSSDRSPAQIALKLSPREEEAFACLKHAVFYSLGPVGLTRLPAPEPHAMALLAQSPAAVRIFPLLLTEASLAGQMFALIGLERVDRAGFERAVAPYLVPDDPKARNQPSEILLRQRGCLVEPMHAVTVARQVFLGRYDAAYTAEQRVALGAKLRTLTQSVPAGTGATEVHGPRGTE
jgi:hypothetical protein